MISARKPSTPGASSEGLESSRLVRYAVPRWIVHCLSYFSLAMLATGIIWSSLDPQGYFLLMGGAACLIVTLPLIFSPSFPAVTPWALVVITVYIGSGIRSPFITLQVQGSRTIDELFLLGRQPSFFIVPGLLYLLGLGLLTLGYFSAQRPSTLGRTRPFMANYTFRPSANFFLALAALIGFVAFARYVQVTGGFSLATLSAKRSVIAGGGDVGKEYSSHGELRLLNLFASVAFWCQIAHYTVKDRAGRLGPARSLYLFALFANAALLPFYASTRQDLVFIAAIGLGVRLCLSSARMSRAFVVGLLAVGLIALPTMTYLRALDQNQRSAVGATRSQVILDTFVYSRSFSDVQVNAQIIRAIPDRLPYAKGATIAAWVAAPIPRSYWPDKPVISAGPVIGQVVFGTPRSGVPPGLISESFWNFGTGGLLLIPGLVGLAIGLLQRKLSAGERFSGAGAVYFSAIGMRLGIDALTNSLGYALFNATQTAAVIAVVLAAAGYAKMRPLTVADAGRSRGYQTATRRPSRAGSLQR